MKTFKISTFIPDMSPPASPLLLLRAVLAVLHQGHLRLICPSTNLLGVQTFKRHLSFLSTTFYCNCLFFLVLFTFVLFFYTYFL